jgi:hypothetical protein
MRSAVRRAIAFVWDSSDSRIPCMRPSMAGRMPIFGQAPTKRPAGLLVMGFVSCREAGAPTVRAGPRGGASFGAYSGMTTPMVSRMLA